MALVNYSSDEDDTDVEDDKEQRLLLPQRAPSSSSSSFSSVATTAATIENVRLQTGSCSSNIDSGGTFLKLPDASQLLASIGTTEARLGMHIGGSAVMSGKRCDLNGSVDGPRKKIPKGNLMPSRVMPDTAGGLLMPPQLRGRSNVATEDLDKLFTKRQKRT